MKLRGIDFGPVLDAAGVRGWFGEGHAFHPFLRPFGLRFDGSTFVAKTTTLHARAGNAAVRRDGLTPRVIGQRCVAVRPLKGVVLNAFGLPGPGLEALLGMNRWQQRTRPFFLSVMAIASSPEESLDEARGLVRLLKPALRDFQAPVGLQVNFSCPNVKAADRLAAFRDHLDEYATLDIPLLVKINAATPIEYALTVAAHPGCDGLCVSNSIPWGSLPDRIDWKGLFGDQSPLEAFGGGGLSGAPLLPIVADWVRDARARGLRKPINAGGGILAPADVDTLVDAGASSVFIGSMAMLRPFRVQPTIRRAHLRFAQQAQGEPDTLPALRRA